MGCVVLHLGHADGQPGGRERAWMVVCLGMGFTPGLCKHHTRTGGREQGGRESSASPYGHATSSWGFEPGLQGVWAHRRQAGGTKGWAPRRSDLFLRVLEHFHGLLHLPFLVALLQQPVAGPEVAQELEEKTRRVKARVGTERRGGRANI